MSIIRVLTLTQTCGACPSQWEGETEDGRAIYVRYRWGWLQVGIGEDLDAAIDDETISVQLGDDLDGQLSFAQLRAATTDCILWPKEY